jgi:putative tricarboxylic transport membrane protein
MLLVLNLPLVGLWVRLLLIPRPYLYGGILVFALIGVWGLSTSWVDLVSMLVVGLAGYVMRVYDFPIAPVLIGLVLGPMAEKQLRQALAIGQGDPLVLVASPLAASLLALALAAFLLPMLLARMKRAAAAPAEQGPV